jgi:CheY-like chemotaxis protein
MSHAHPAAWALTTATPHNPNRRSVEILLVEDNPNDVKLAMHAFKKHPLANSVQVVRDGAEALEYLFCTGSYSTRDIRNVPKLILLDLKLPKVDGLKFCAASRPTRTRVPHPSS